MRLLIDGNVILDVLQNRKPFAEDSAKVWKMCEAGMVEGYLSVLTFANLVYVMRKELDPEKIEEIRKKLALIFRFLDLTTSDLASASAKRWDDFEDALQAAAAERINAGAIITRNLRDFEGSGIPAITPESFLVYCP